MKSCKKTSESFEKEIGEFCEAMAPGQFMEELFSATEDMGFFIKNLDGKFISCNETFHCTFGIEKKCDILGMRDCDIMPAFLADSVMKDDKRVMKTKKPIVKRIELLATESFIPDWRITTKIPVFSKSGSVIGIAGVTRVIRSSDKMYQSHPEVSRVLAYIRANYKRKISINDIAREAGMSISSVERLFKKLFKTTPIKYLKKVRLNVACKLLRSENTPISQIVKECGFYDQSSMNRDFRSVLNITPLGYRKRSKK